MIDILVGESIKILNFKYNSKTFGFEVECIMPGATTSGIYRFTKQYFPKHTPVQFLDEKVQVGEAVHVWIKEEELLKNERWEDLTKYTLTNPDSSFKIGKEKKVYLGGVHKGVICLDEKVQPIVVINGYCFSAKEIKCVLKLEEFFNGKNAKICLASGEWLYLADQGILKTGYGTTFRKDDINVLIDLMRKAQLL